MPGYLLATLDMIDESQFIAYRKAVDPMIAELGGEILVNTPEPQVMAGSPPPRRVVILRFPSLEKATEFMTCDRYQPLIALRERAARVDIVVMEGRA